MVFVVFKNTHMETLVNNIDNEIIVIAINNGVYLTPKKLMRRFSLLDELDNAKAFDGNCVFCFQKKTPMKTSWDHLNNAISPLVVFLQHDCFTIIADSNPTHSRPNVSFFSFNLGHVRLVFY
jgi:hypothetical protein